MNILIKNADFSDVSIGTAGIIEKESTLTNILVQAISQSNPAGLGYASQNKVLCYDVSDMDGQKVKVKGYCYSTVFAHFYSAVAPDDTTYSSSDISSLNAYMGAPLATCTGTSQTVSTVIVEVPVGAKTLCVYAASNHENDCSVVAVG